MTYIEREKLINELECLPEQGELSYLGVYDCVNTIPAADVVEVVRCKDCKWYQNLEIVDKIQTRCFNLLGLCRVCNPNDFCRYGERKDGE